MAQLPSSGKGSKAVNPNAHALQCTRQMQQTVWRGFAAAALRIRLSNSHSAVVIAFQRKMDARIKSGHDD
jgi:hypothetical protein